MKTIVYDFLSTLLDIINAVFVGIIQIIFQGFLDGSLNPSITKMDEILNGNVSTITEWCAWASGFLIAIFFACRLISTFSFGTMGSEVKSSIYTLFTRLVFCAIILLFTKNFGDFVLDVGMNAYDKAIEYFGEQAMGDDDTTADYGKLGDNAVKEGVFTLADDFKSGSLLDTDPAEVTVFGVAIGATLSGMTIFSEALVAITLIALLIRIICLIICGYNLIKLIVELASRYVMMMVLYMGLPLAIPFYIAIETEQTFFTYLKMFATETGVLVLTQAWISIVFYMYSRLNSSLVAIFIFISFVRIGCRLEQLLKDLGLSTSSMGGALFNEVALSAGIMAVGASRLGHLIGTGALNVGAFTGNMRLGQVGAGILGKGVGVDSVSKAMADSLGGAARAAKDYAGMNPLSRAILQGMDARLLPNILASAGRKDAKTMTDGVLNDVYGNLLDANGKVKGYKVSTTGTIGKNGLGVVLSNGERTLNGVISEQKAGKGFTSIPFNDINGRQVYLNVANESTREFTSDELALGTPDGQPHVANMTSEFGEGTDISYAINENGTASVYANDSLIGIVTPNGEELYASRTDFGADNMKFEQITHIDPHNPENVTAVQKSLDEIVGTDTGADTKLKIAAMFAPHDEKGLENRINYNGQTLRYASGGSEQLANIVKAKDIDVDSITYDKKTGNFEFDTTTGKHFEFADACHGYATHNGKIIGNKQTGHYYVKESKQKLDSSKKK